MKQLFTAGIIASAACGVMSAPAQAFSFTTNFEGDSATEDIWLQSIEMEDGTLIDSFSLINSAKIVYNDEYNGGNSGAASADIGDNATTGVKVEDATPEDLVANLNNLNLNNIIDTEDKGSFQIDLFFDNPIDNLLIWERGKNSGNSALAVQALGNDGNLIGQKTIVDFRDLGSDYSAGYSINTQEIGGAQAVGSFGLTMDDLGVGDAFINGFRFFSEAKFNGPDWKIMGTNAQREGGPADIPEPGTVFGLAVIGGAIARLRRP